MTTLLLTKRRPLRTAKAEVFTIVCAWCNRVRCDDGWRHEPGCAAGPTVSHGICPDCFDAQIARCEAQREGRERL